MNDDRMNDVLAFVEPRLPQWHQQGYVPSTGWQAMAALIPMGTGDLTTVHDVIRCLVQTRDIGLAGTYAINEICARLLITTGAEELLPKVRGGEVRLALGLTEPQSGSALTDMRTFVTPEAPGLLNGHKTFISNGTVADVHIVAARTQDSDNRMPLMDLYLVPREQLRITELRGTGSGLMRLADVELVDVPVSPQRRVGRQGRGFAHISEVLTFERAVVACLATEFAKVVLEDLGSYLMDHQIFGAPLSEHGYHRLRLGEWWAEYRVLSAATRSMLAGFAADNVSWREVFSLKLMSSIFIRKLAVEVQHLGGAASWVAGGRWAGLADDVRWLCLAGGASEVLQARLASDALKQTKTAATR